MHLHKHIVKTAEYAEGRIEDALRQAFLKIDQAMMGDEELMDELSGTTAVTALLKNNTLYVVIRLNQVVIGFAKLAHHFRQTWVTHGL